MKPRLLCSRETFSNAVNTVKIPYYFFGRTSETTWDPEMGIGVGKMTTRGASMKVVDASNYFHELAHIALLVFRNELDKLNNFDLKLYSPRTCDTKKALQIYTTEAIVVGMQIKLAQHFGFVFNVDKLISKESYTFSYFTTNEGRDKLVRHLPIKTVKPKLLDGIHDQAVLPTNSPLEAVRRMYFKRRDRAQRSYIASMIRQHMDDYTIPEILDAIGRAECFIQSNGEQP